MTSAVIDDDVASRQRLVVVYNLQHALWSTRSLELIVFLDIVSVGDHGLDYLGSPADSARDLLGNLCGSLLSRFAGNGGSAVGGLGDNGLRLAYTLDAHQLSLEDYRGQAVRADQMHSNCYVGRGYTPRTDLAGIGPIDRWP